MMKTLKIDIICNDGSPLGVTLSDIYGESGRVGIGGAELALLTMCEGWHNVGHEVTLYNNPHHYTNQKLVQKHLDQFHPLDNRDILIIFRSPNVRIQGATGKKVWWSCDQYTIGNFAEFSKSVDRIVTISDFHAKHFENFYGIKDTTTIDLPVRVWDYNEPIEKIKNRLIFCSVPDRGLELLAQAYPKIKEAVPDVSLTVTSDYRLWGVPDARNERYLQRFLGMRDVEFVGAVPRREMVKLQQQAEIQAYPCIYDELFCIATAECQVAGTLPITSDVGALETTNMGIVIPYQNVPQWVAHYADEVIRVLQSPDRPDVQTLATSRFSLDKIMEEWDKVFYE